MDNLLKQPGLFVIPIEQLSEIGIAKSFQTQLVNNQLMQITEVELFNTAWKKYWQRAKLLYQADPNHWFPPRCQHIGIVTDSSKVRPFFQPFNNNSWLLYRSDFNLKDSSLELATYLFLHAERQWLMQSPDITWRANLAYFLVLSEQQKHDFHIGCQRSTRPDHLGFQALAEAFPIINTMYHRFFKPPNTEPEASVFTTDHLYIPTTCDVPLNQLKRTWININNECIKNFMLPFSTQKKNNAKQLLNWLQKTQPKLILSATDEIIVWAPKYLEISFEINALEQLLHNVHHEVIDSLIKDLKIIDSTTQDFFSRLKTPDQLAKPASYLQPGGLCYVHPQYGLINYSLCIQQHPTRLQLPALPYSRLMLQARTAHEWGHLTAESGWVEVKNKDQKNSIKSKIIELLDDILKNTSDKTQGSELLKRLFVRIEDYQANLMAQHLLPRDAMEVYVRNNVHTHWQDYSKESHHMLLLRYAYEFQYLHLISIKEPMKWFLSSTWFAEYYFQQGIITVKQFEQLVNHVKELCSMYTIDQTRLNR